MSEVAMLDLEPQHTSQERRRSVFKQHHQFIGDIFAYILTSDIWTEGQGEAMEQLLLSPTIDSNDQQVIISAMTLAAMNCFDIVKFRVLMNVYLQSSDEYVRQRALVGWVLSIDDHLHQDLFPEQADLVKKALENPNCGKELVELQKQIYYCMSAEEDRDTIQKEIMPDLIKSQRNMMTRDDVLEQDEESILNDILHPDEEEKNLEKVEASFHRMIDMQKQGSDIYFGGFSQMKRFSFFNDITNWFTPYYKEHPGISQLFDRFGNVKFLQGILRWGPFCNSDKYSFVLAFDSVLMQIPENVRKMLDRGEAEMVQKLEQEELNTPAYIRRIYLQDLFRFFRLFSQRQEFRNFFSYDHFECLFFDDEVFLSTKLQDHYHDIIVFLMKRNRIYEAKELIGDYEEEKYYTYDYYMLSAYLRNHKVADYQKALEIRPNDERALSGLGKALFEDEEYDQALNVFNQLLEINPNKKSYLLSKLNRYDEAEQILFRLNYEDAGNLNVARVLAWTLTCNGKTEQAGRLYDQLMAEEEPADVDMLNYGFYLWLTGKINEAADCFRTYENNTKDQKEEWLNVHDLIKDEAELLHKNGIVEEEISMMSDLIGV